MDRLVLIFAILFVSLFLSLKDLEINSRTRQAIFLFISFLIYTLHSGLRHWSVGPDTYQYNTIFENVKAESIDIIWDNVLTNNGIDPFYDLFQKVFQFVSSDYQIYLVFVGIIFFSSFCFFLFDNLRSVQQIVLANLIFIAYFSGFYSITGIRQTIATSILMYAFAFLKRKKHLLFILFILLASLFHITSLIFLLTYFLLNKRSILISLFSIASFFIIFQYRYVLTPIVTLFLFSESRFDVYTEKYVEGGSYKLTFLNIILAIVILVFHYFSKKKEDLVLTYSSNLFVCSIIFLPLQWVNPSAGRIGMYFSLFLVIILPILISKIGFSENKRIIFNSAIATFILLTFFSSLENRYLFFWQNN